MGILLMIVALLTSDLPTRAVLENLRHISLILAITLSSIYTIAILMKKYERLIPTKLATKLYHPKAKSYSDFSTMLSTTLSNELCSCLHPVLMLEMLGISILIPSQVKTGFLLMTMVLTHQVRMNGSVLLASWRKRT
jgi:hypothetical protein